MSISGPNPLMGLQGFPFQNHAHSQTKGDIYFHIRHQHSHSEEIVGARLFLFHPHNPPSHYPPQLWLPPSSFSSSYSDSFSSPLSIRVRPWKRQMSRGERKWSLGDTIWCTGTRSLTLATPSPYAAHSPCRRRHSGYTPFFCWSVLEGVLGRPGGAAKVGVGVQGGAGLREKYGRNNKEQCLLKGKRSGKKGSHPDGKDCKDVLVCV